MRPRSRQALSIIVGLAYESAERTGSLSFGREIVALERGVFSGSIGLQGPYAARALSHIARRRLADV